MLFRSSHLRGNVALTESTLLRGPRALPHNEPSRNDRAVLLDSNKQAIVGTKQITHKALYKPIMHNNRIVAYVGIEKQLELSRKLDRVFSQQQQQNFIFIAIGSVLISLLIAFPFASKIIKPIHILLNATRLLTKGDYSQRIEEKNKDEIGQLTRAFNEMASSLEKHEQIKSQWLADISHELRTPLAVIKAEIDAMLDGIRDIDLKNIRSLNQEIDYINSLVNDLHKLSKYDLDSLKPQKEQFDLTLQISETLDSFKDEFKTRGLTVELSTNKPLIIDADQRKLTQVLFNLIQNNLRYTMKNGLIRISCNSADKAVELIWQDSGPGVKEENLKKLFDRLYREDLSRSEQHKASGLGLSICKSIIESHNGTIEAFQSSLGGLGLKILLPQKN